MVLSRLGCVALGELANSNWTWFQVAEVVSALNRTASSPLKNAVAVVLLLFPPGKDFFWLFFFFALFADPK